jgi:hypothetical protein
MLASVQLDDDTCFDAGKITDIRSDRMLPAKLKAVDLSSPQTAPKQALGLGLVFSEVTRVAKHPSK